MKRNVVIIFLNIALVSLLLAMTSKPGATQVQPDVGKPYPINVGAGQAVSICKTGTIICPARYPICDDTSVATVRGGKDGLEIVGVKPGATLCSAMSAVGLRAIYAVTVR
jgi:hypothetical protein